MSDNTIKPLVRPNVATRRVHLYPNEDPNVEQPLVMLSGTKEGWHQDKADRDQLMMTLANKVTTRIPELIKQLIDIHKSMVDNYLTVELDDFIDMKKVWKYADVITKYTPSKIDHIVDFNWVTTEQHDTIALQIGADNLGLVILFEKDRRPEYGFAALGYIHCNNMRQVMGEHRAFDYLTAYQSTQYQGAIENVATEINKVIETIRDEMICERDGISLAELKDRQNGNKLLDCLEQLKRRYIDRASKSLSGFGRRDYYHNVETKYRTNRAEYTVKLDWLTVTMIVYVTGDINYSMPILNIQYDNINTLINERFSHLSSVSHWDTNRYLAEQMNTLEAKIATLTVDILKYNQEQDALTPTSD